MTCYIGGIQRFSTEDGPGIRTTVFFAGCPLRCKWCHNPELYESDFLLLRKPDKCIGCHRCEKACGTGALTFQDGIFQIDRSKCTQCGNCVSECPAEALRYGTTEFQIEQVAEEVMKDASFYQNSGGLTLSGGEVLSHAKEAMALAEKVRENGISVAIETSGYGAYEDLKTLAMLSDDILFDLKCMDEQKHKEFVGQSPKRIWDNLRKLCLEEHLQSKITIRVPLMEHVNTDMENIQKLCAFMQELGLERLNLLPYHNMGLQKARELGMEQEEFQTPSDKQLLQIRQYCMEQGIDTEVMGLEEEIH